MISLILSFLFVWLLGNWIAKERNFRKKHKLLPGPVNLPFIGGLLQPGLERALYCKDELHHLKLNRLCTNYGSPMMIQAGVLTGVLAADYDSVKQIMSSNDWTARFPSHPRYREHTFFKYLGILTNSGESWKAVRTFLIRSLRSFGFGELRTSEEFLKDELSHLIVDIDKRREENNDELEMTHFFKLPSLNVIWRVLAGDRYSYDDKRIKHIVVCVDEITRMQVGIDLEWHFPFLRFIPGFANSRSKRYWFEECYSLFRDIIAERREKGDYKMCQTNIIDLFLQKIDETKESGSELFTDDQLLATCNDLLFAGVDTTSTAMEWGIVYLLVFPGVQKKIQEEIDAVIGPIQTPSLADRIKMPYTEAVMLETLRMGTVIPAMARTSTCDTEVNGCFVPKDTFCGNLLAIVHQDPKIWGDPENFRPERFLDENMKINNKDQYILAFGTGKRMCPGYVMGKVTWFMFITTILQRYTLSPAPNRSKPSLVPNSGVISSVRSYHCKMTLRERRQSTSM